MQNVDIVVWNLHCPIGWRLQPGRQRPIEDRATVRVSHHTKLPAIAYANHDHTPRQRSEVHAHDYPGLRVI